MANHYTSVLAARLGTHQCQAFLRSESLADRVDGAVRRAWEAEWRKLRGHGDSHDLHHRLASAIRRLVAVATEVISDGLHWQVAMTHREARRVVLSSLPAAHRAALVAARSPAPALTEETDKNKRQQDEIVFPSPTKQKTESIVSGSWVSRIAKHLAAAVPNALQAIVGAWRLGVGMVLKTLQPAGKPKEIKEFLEPLVDDLRTDARKIARTDGQRVAMGTRKGIYDELGSLVLGYQIHALMDSHTRPHHAERSGTTYWVNPEPGQLGLDQMPHPPTEPDGSLAFNCRCWLTPILDIHPNLKKHKDSTVVFADAKRDLIPDPATYSDWFARSGEEERKIAVGASRITSARERLDTGEPLSWASMMATDGTLLTAKEITRESDAQRVVRMARVSRMIADRRILARAITTAGYLPPNQSRAI